MSDFETLKGDFIINEKIFRRKGYILLDSDTISIKYYVTNPEKNPTIYVYSERIEQFYNKNWVIIPKDGNGTQAKYAGSSQIHAAKKAPKSKFRKIEPGKKEKFELDLTKVFALHEFEKEGPTIHVTYDGELEYCLDIDESPRKILKAKIVSIPIKVNTEKP